MVEPRVWRWRTSPPAPGSVVLVLDAVQDPGNVGTMLRTALGLGAAGVVALKGTAELTNPKVLRGSMGARSGSRRSPPTRDALLAWVAERGVEIWVAAADGDAARPPRRGRTARRSRSWWATKARAWAPARRGGEPPGGDPARARGRVAQRGGGGRHPSVRGHA